EFCPECFLVHDGKQPKQDACITYFGFGRRSVRYEVDTMYHTHLCAVSVLVVWMSGLPLADVSVWLLTAMTLAIFNITKVVTGNVEFTP
ncbi:hypothetical protein SCLCIDRAFT_139396, partial [Scleroderma citrinum Foug A]